MIWNDPLYVAGGILLGGSGVVTMILRARGLWVRNARDIQYDEGQAKWVRDMQDEATQLRREKEELWKSKIEDIRNIEQLKAENNFLRKEVDGMSKTIAQLETALQLLRSKMMVLNEAVGAIDDVKPV